MHPACLSGMPACCHGATVKITLKFKFFNFSKVNETKDLEGIGSSFLTAYALLVGRMQTMLAVLVVSWRLTHLSLI